MNQEDQTPKPRRFRFRPALHIAMGILYLILAGAVLTMKQFGTVTLSPAISYGMGGLLLVYGVFRLWRGIQDMRMSDHDE